MADTCECHQEVARLHQFFQDWFQGVLDVDDFAVCEQALADGFTIITPGGDMVERKEILEAIRIHRGGEPAAFQIRTVGRSCQQVRGLHLSTYEEHQTGTRATVRLSTAVIGSGETGFVWHAVHETWITAA
ncbi:MAG: hypothetical protein ACN4GZ_05465 [Acidimicrobiales bacterium]